MSEFEELLEISATEHGHLCPGQVIGVRMALLGRKYIGIRDFKEEIKNIIVYVEIDRCASDTLATVTGCKLGRRSLKFIDNGIMAATFLHLKTGKAVRIAAKDSARESVAQYAPHLTDTREKQTYAYKVMPDDELFSIENVEVDFNAETDSPGPTKKKALCEVCGVIVRDGKEVVFDGKVSCRNCGGQTYFKVLEQTE